MKSKKTKIIGITLIIISVASILACAGIISYCRDESESPNNNSFCQDCPEISQEDLAVGWYYGQLNQKKPGTPDTWLHKGEGTRSAMWFDTSLILVKP